MSIDHVHLSRRMLTGDGLVIQETSQVTVNINYYKIKRALQFHSSVKVCLHTSLKLYLLTALVAEIKTQKFDSSIKP